MVSCNRYAQLEVTTTKKAMPSTTPENVITDQMRSFIGVASRPVSYEISRWDVARFACAIGDANPLYSDEAAARESAISGLIAPPTFLRSLLPGPSHEPFPEPFAHILDAGSRYRFLHPVRVGDVITVSRTLKDMFTKSGRLGTMLFKVREITYTNQLGQIVATQETTTITYGERSGDDAGSDFGEIG